MEGEGHPEGSQKQRNERQRSAETERRVSLRGTGVMSTIQLLGIPERPTTRSLSSSTHPNTRSPVRTELREQKVLPRVTSSILDNHRGSGQTTSFLLPRF